MVLHVKLILVCQMVIHGTLAEYREYPIVLAEKNVSQLFLSIELFQLFR
jgi:hypothetical protein